MSEHSPTVNASPADGPPRKRKRKTYSCVDCRRRKLKCDREQPCGRCQWEGHPQTCVFSAESGADLNASEIEEPDTASRQYPIDNAREPTVSSVMRRIPFAQPTGPKYQPQAPNERNGSSSENLSETVPSLRRKVEYLEMRVAALESSNQGLVGTGSTTGLGLGQHESNGVGEQPAPFFKGKGLRPHFYGPTSAASMIHYFPEIHAFTKDPQLLQTPLARVQKDFDGMRARAKERKRQTRHIEESIFSLLPSREVVDRLIRLYFDTYERAYRILHRPTFWAEYGNGDYRGWSEPFAAIVLLTLASVSCLSTTELSFHADNSTARETAERWVAAVELWFSRQSHKHITLESFQIHCLLLLAKRNNVIKRKRAWVISGQLVRMAASSGLHLEPSHVDRHGANSPYDQEMQRRLWATIFEWDLDASITRGVPPLASSIPSDCRAPLNINDDQFDKQSKEPPEPRPWSERTETSFLSLALRSLSLRTSLASLLNDPNVHMGFEDALRYEARINKELDKLPDWIKHPNVRTCSGLPNVFQAITYEGALLDIQLRQFLVLLYDPFSRSGSSAQQTYSRMACMTASSKILDHHFKLAAAGNHALSLQDAELYGSILTISLNMHLESQNATMSKSLAVSLQPLVDQAISILEDKALRLGEWYHNFWFACAAFALSSCELEGRAEEARDKAVERILRLFYKVLAFQTKQNPTPPNQTPLPSVSYLGSDPPTVGPDATPILEKAQLPPLQNAGPHYDFATLNGLSNWELDDLWGFDTINL